MPGTAIGSGRSCGGQRSATGGRRVRGDRRSEVDLGTELIPNYLRTDQFYLRLFVAAHRYLTGERRHLSW